MEPRTTVYLVRHAESEPSADVAEPSWPLSARGLAQAAALVPVMQGLGLRAIYSSPFLRARQTLAPLALALGTEVTVVDALRERALGRVTSHADHRDMVARYWADPDFALPGGESNAACARRVTQVIAQLALRHRGETIAVASHGNAIALYLGTLDPGFGWVQWREMRNPDRFRVVYEDGRATWDGTRLPTTLEP
jgi:2,3-bisphosphoglycerate-dependent phosphoglycerate mutase